VSLRRTLSNNLYNAIGWRTRRKIVVIESDDWGMIRVASKAAQAHFVAEGLPIDRCIFNQFDALENNEDMEQLLDTLLQVRDQHGYPAPITINNIVANPDFEKIADSDYQTYHFEPFTRTLERYPHHDRVLDLYWQGIQLGAFRPQFHGREHVRVHPWMAYLRAGDPLARAAFDQQMFSVVTIAASQNRMEFMDAFACSTADEAQALEQAMKEGMDLFEQIWGYRSATVIAPCYTWHPKLESVWHHGGIRGIQSGRAQVVPVMGSGRNKSIRHYVGQRNRLGQVYLVRNVFFETCLDAHRDWVDTALYDVKTAFRYRKPAIINTHRVNYMGGLDPNNRTRGLRLLRQLLQQIVRQWPDVEFMSSDQLTDLITAKSRQTVPQ
jgi:hypothetical protein